LPRPSRFDILFEPIRIGPVTSKNRFYQVPHCNGMGRAYPSPVAAMRGIKAEGGWGVVCTEQCDIHYSGQHQRELRLWDAQDIPTLARASDQIHEHGALAGVELAHNGGHVAPSGAGRRRPRPRDHRRGRAAGTCSLAPSTPP
jgi:dimethylamine/trimethylamine dehydrogenase